MPEEDKEFIKDMVDEMNLNRAKGKEDIIVYSMNVSDEDIFKLVPTPEN